MTSTMGDAEHAHVPQLWLIRDRLSVVAGYVTGSPDIVWTPADWALFADIPHATIDQGFTGSPNMNATIRDVEPGAWTPEKAVDKTGWNVPRPTIYCDRDELPAVLAAGWRGDLWLAIPKWQPGQPLPAAPGCTIVAVQNDYTNPDYDLSVVLDATWPNGDPMATVTTQQFWYYCQKCHGMFYTTLPSKTDGVCPAGGQHDGTISNGYAQLQVSQ